MAIVRHIYNKGEAKASELKTVPGNYDRLKINIRIDEKPRLTYTYTLTKRGKSIAEKLSEIDEMLRERA